MGKTGEFHSFGGGSAIQPNNGFIKRTFFCEKVEEKLSPWNTTTSIYSGNWCNVGIWQKMLRVMTWTQYRFDLWNVPSGPYCFHSGSTIWVWPCCAVYWSILWIEIFVQTVYLLFLHCSLFFLLWSHSFPHDYKHLACLFWITFRRLFLHCILIYSFSINVRQSHLFCSAGWLICATWCNQFLFEIVLHFRWVIMRILLLFIKWLSWVQGSIEEI